MAGIAEMEEVKATALTETETDRSDIESTRGETYVTPVVDIYEIDDELVLVADVPGVEQEGIDLKLENRVLEITAHRMAMQKDKPTYAEFRPASYYRAFSLSNAIESEKINASLRDGVLTVRLPKSPEVKPRTIAVKTG
jgi:HSP20 family protein